MNQQHIETMRALDIAMQAIKAFGDMLDKIEENAEQELQRKAA